MRDESQEAREKRQPKAVGQILNERPWQGESGRTSNESGQREQRRGASRQVIQSLWQMMSSMYGHRWASAYGEEVDPDRVWSATLAGLTPEQIQAGLQRCVQSGDDWPPSAPAFRKMCRGSGEWGAFQERANDFKRQIAEQRLLLTDQGKRERAEVAGAAALKDIKSMIRGMA